MREIKKLTLEQLRPALLIGAKAYPMMPINTDEQLNERVEYFSKDFGKHGREWYGLFENGIMLGIMVLFDFKLHYYTRSIKARGIGFVAVDFLHKKQKVCKEMLSWFLQDSVTQKYPLAMLHAFRPDFYKRMGFGYGTMCDKYVSSPERFPHYETTLSPYYLDYRNRKEVMDFYNELYYTYHGMVRKNQASVDTLLNLPGLESVGFYDYGKLCALLHFRLIANEATEQATHMDMELLFTSPEGLKAALSFLNSQSDQVSRINFSTFDPQLFYSFSDIRHLDGKSLREPAFHHTTDNGMGIMYRSLDHVYLITHKPCTLDKFSIRFVLQDDFCPNGMKEFCIRWNKGKARLSKSSIYDVELKLRVADFASWVMNCIDLDTLYLYGLLDTNDKYVLSTLDAAFYFPGKPRCLERF